GRSRSIGSDDVGVEDMSLLAARHLGEPAGEVHPDLRAALDRDERHILVQLEAGQRRPFELKGIAAQEATIDETALWRHVSDARVVAQALAHVADSPVAAQFSS